MKRRPRPKPIDPKRIDKLDVLVDDATAVLIDALRTLHPAIVRLNGIRWERDAVRRPPPKRRKAR